MCAPLDRVFPAFWRQPDWMHACRRALLRLCWGSPACVRPLYGKKPSGVCRGLTILAEGAQSTLAYYLLNRAMGLSQHANFQKDFSITRIDAASSVWRRPPAADVCRRLFSGRQVIVARHVGKDWLRALARHRDSIWSVAYFMDDDLPGAFADTALPWRYGLRLSLRFGALCGAMSALSDRVWFSTEALSRRYPESSAAVLPPLPLEDDREDEQRATQWHTGGKTIFYHGTSSHTQELAFVAEVARRVQSACSNTWFEVFGPHRSLRDFRGIPRVRRMHPLPWADYVHHVRSTPLHIGLAPLCGAGQGRGFNACRSAVKVFDIARAGAAGVYSDVPVFREHVRHGVSGLLLPDEPELWAQHIVRLVNCPEEAQGLARGAVQHAAGQRERLQDVRWLTGEGA